MTRAMLSFSWTWFWETSKGTVLLVGGFMFFLTCIYAGLFLSVAIWQLLASLI